MSDNIYCFSHKGGSYFVEWETEGMNLVLTYSNEKEVLKTQEIKLLGGITESELKELVKDYWKSFVKKELKDLMV